MRFSVDIPKKRLCGGTRAIRFARIRKERRQNYIEKVFDIAVQCFTADGKAIVDGIILANVIEFNSDLRCPNIINPVGSISFLWLGLFSLKYLNRFS